MRRALAVVVLMAAFGCTRTASQTTQSIPTAPPGGALVAFRAHVLGVELAVNQSEWAHGLMDRPKLDRDAGMLFLFPEPSSSPFYMYRTLVPLSVAFMKRERGQTYRVLKILDMAPCHLSSDKCPLYDPHTTYDVALEVNRGWFVRHGVHAGSTGRVGRAPK